MLLDFLSDNPTVATIIVGSIAPIIAGILTWRGSKEAQKRAVEEFNLDYSGKIIEGFEGFVLRLQAEIVRLEDKLGKVEKALEDCRVIKDELRVGAEKLVSKIVRSNGK